MYNTSDANNVQSTFQRPFKLLKTNATATAIRIGKSEYEMNIKKHTKLEDTWRVSMYGTIRSVVTAKVSQPARVEISYILMINIYIEEIVVTRHIIE